MSRTPAFSRGMFDVLAQEGDEEEEVEVEEVEESKVDSAADSTSTTPSTLSKSAKKRLAKAARAAETSDRVPAPVSNGVKAAKEKVDQNGGIDATAEKATAQVEQSLKAVGEKVQSVVNGDWNGIKEQVSKTVEPIVAKATQVAEVAAESVSNGLGLSSDNAAGSQDKERRLSRSSDSPRHIGSSFVPPPSQPSSSATKSNGGRKSSFAKPASASPPSSKFQPELPDELPHPKANALPANRKRKQPVDFTPSGPGVDGALSQSSSKMGVKFEDGLVPGQGKDGETTIPVKPKADRNMVERTTWTFIMIGGFIALLCAGHPYMILLVLLCQTLVYKEITALFELRDEGSKKTDVADKWSKTLNWYFFVVTNYFLYGESIIYYFKHIIFVDAVFIPFARNHRFISFMLYVMGFVGFVANLDRRFLRQQFALFCWVHITLLLVVVSSHFIVNNILEGLVWFFIPASLVICNDVMAYICGKTFGKTPLIKLSPKKTVEGFVGAFICTLIFGLAWSTFFMRFNYMICPARDLGTSVFSNVQCRPNPVFIWRDFTITGPIGKIFETVLGRAPPSIPYTPFHIHTLVMATFASLVAPFGGFFASGFKRAFNIKDFGHSIPGHGGMTDRMDCQFMMGLFAYVYYSSLIRIQYVTVGSILQSVVTNLSGPEQLELLTDLRRYLEGQGLKVKA